VGAVPINWRDPDAGTLSLFVKRVGNFADPNAKALWFLQGGPGGAGNAYEGLSEMLLNNDPTLTMYMLDHRGTGRSTRLGCPSQEAPNSDEGYNITAAEWPSCIAAMQAEHGDGLDYFSTTMAATDLGMLIKATRGPDQPVILHGTSYGTRWAQRYLQIFPDQPTGVSMLGVVAPSFSFARYNQQYETVGADYLARCGADEFCASKLGADPESTFRAVMGDIGGRCPEAVTLGLNRAALQDYFGQQLLWARDERLIPLAIIYRINRCNDDDIDALTYFAQEILPNTVSVLDDPFFSRAINHHVGLSDLWEGPNPTLEDERTLMQDALWAFGTNSKFELEEFWPTYPRDEYMGSFATTSAAMLMQNGDLDPASTHAEAVLVGDHYDGPNQTFVTLPGAAHSWTTPTTEGYDCGVNQFYGFIQDPLKQILDCTAIVLPLDFHGNAQLASVFNTLDLWENAQPTSGSQSNLLRERIIQRTRDFAARSRAGGL
jgi:pimeloyl-ACP methyl ester carboxylesterase